MVLGEKGGSFRLGIGPEILSLEMSRKSPGNNGKMRGEKSPRAIEKQY